MNHVIVWIFLGSMVLTGFILTYISIKIRKEDRESGCGGGTAGDKHS